MNPHDGQEPLDPDTIEHLSAGVAADAPPLSAAATARVKGRVLQRIAGDQLGQHLTVQAGDGRWLPFAPGVEFKLLHDGGAIWSYLLRLAPGAQLPAHRHPVNEECVVLEGAVSFGPLQVSAGGYHLGREGVLHLSMVSERGAVLFLRGARPDPSQQI